MIKAGTPKAKVAIMLVRIVIDREQTVNRRVINLSIMDTVRSFITIYNEMLPQSWMDVEIINRALATKPNYRNVYWKRGVELYTEYCNKVGKYTGNERAIRELIEYAEGLHLENL